MSVNYLMNCLGEGSKWACADSTIDFVLNRSPESACSTFVKTLVVMTAANYFIPKAEGHPDQKHFDKQAKRLEMISSAFFASLVSYGTSWKVVKNPDKGEKNQ